MVRRWITEWHVSHLSTDRDRIQDLNPTLVIVIIIIVIIFIQIITTITVDIIIFSSIDLFCISICILIFVVKTHRIHRYAVVHLVEKLKIDLQYNFQNIC